MSNAFIQALLMDDPDAGGGSSAWPDPPGSGEPADPGTGPPGSTYACITPEIGNKAAYTAGTVLERYTGNKDIFSDVVTPYGDGIIVGPSTVPTASLMYKAVASGDVTFISVKFMLPSLVPIDDHGSIFAGQGYLRSEQLFALTFAREKAFDGNQSPWLYLRNVGTNPFTEISMGGIPATNQWYVFELTIAGAVASYSIRTADTGVLFASGTVPGSWGPLPNINTFMLWNDANVNTGTAYVAALRFCGYADASIPGTEKLTGIGMTATAGDVNSPAGFRRLTGQSMTAAAGSVSVFNANRTVALTGQLLVMSRGSLAYLPYPNLISETIDLNPIPTWGALEVTFLNDGTYLIEQVTYSYFGKVTYTGRWIDDSEIAETAIAHQYRCAALANYGDGTPTLDTGVSGALGRVSVAFVVPPTFTQYVEFSISVVPRVGNPRYGEIGYTGTFRISIPLYYSLPP